MARRRYYSRTAALIGSSREGDHKSRRRRRRRSINIRWKVVIPVVLGIAALTAFFLLPDFWYLESNTFFVHGVPAEMHRDVQITSGLYGWHAFSLRPAQAREALKQAYPDMRDIEVKCRYLPARCDINFTLRDPVLAWVTPVRTILIDNTDNIPYAFRETLDVVDLPIITGPLPDGEFAETELRQVLQGVDALGALGIPVNSLVYDPLRGLVWVDEAGRAVAFGVGPDMQVRWETYQEMLAYFDSRGVSPGAIDVRFPAGVTYSQ